MMLNAVATGLVGLGLRILPEPAFASEPPPVIHVVRTVVQTRFQETAVNIVPGLSSLVTSESPSLREQNLKAIRDTARAGDGISLRRAWLVLEATPLERLRGELRLDFAKLFKGGESFNVIDPLEVALAEVEVTRGFYAGIGRFELPFSLFELVHDPDFELAEKGPTYDLVEHLGYAGSDTGALVRVLPFKKPERLEVQASATSGSATGAQEFRGPGLFASRILGEPIDEVRVGAGVSWRPRPVNAFWEEYRFSYRAYDPGAAYGVDATVTLEPVSFRAEWLSGDRTDVDVKTPRLLRRGDARTFRSVWAMALLRLPAKTFVFIPALRGEWLDSDAEHDTVGGIVHLSAGLNVDFSKHFRLLWDLSQHYVQPGTKNWRFDILRYDADSLAGTVQLQVEL